MISFISRMICIFPQIYTVVLSQIYTVVLSPATKYVVLRYPGGPWRMAETAERGNYEGGGQENLSQLVGQSKRTVMSRSRTEMKFQWYNRSNSRTIGREEGRRTVNPADKWPTPLLLSRVRAPFLPLRPRMLLFFEATYEDDDPFCSPTDDNGFQFLRRWHCLFFSSLWLDLRLIMEYGFLTRSIYVLKRIGITPVRKCARETIIWGLKRSDIVEKRKLEVTKYIPGKESFEIRDYQERKIGDYEIPEQIRN